MSDENLARTLTEHPFFRDFKDDWLEFLAGCASRRRLATGEFLIQEGREATDMYLVKRGRMILETHVSGTSAASIQTVEKGETVGWSWLFPPYKWRFDARALQPSSVIVFSGACLRQKLEQDHEMGFVFMKAIIRLLSERLESTRVQLLDVYGKDGEPCPRQR